MTGTNLVVGSVPGPAGLLGSDRFGADVAEVALNLHAIARDNAKRNFEV